MFCTVSLRLSVRILFFFIVCSIFLCQKLSVFVPLWMCLQNHPNYALGFAEILILKKNTHSMTSAIFPRKCSAPKIHLYQSIDLKYTHSVAYEYTRKHLLELCTVTPLQRQTQANKQTNERI